MRAGMLVHMGVLVHAGVLAQGAAGKDGRGAAGNEPRPWRHQDTHLETDPQQHPVGLAAQGQCRALCVGTHTTHACAASCKSRVVGGWPSLTFGGHQHLRVSFRKLLKLVK